MGNVCGPSSLGGADDLGCDSSVRMSRRLLALAASRHKIGSDTHSQAERTRANYVLLRAPLPA